MFQLRLFGGASLIDGGTPLTGRVVQRRRLALLALLASPGGRPVTRDKLVSCLWPERSASSARHSLSDTLHIIHKELGELAVLSDRDELRLNPRVVACDVIEFESALAKGDLEHAVGAYAGPFLDGFFVGGDAMEFESWAALERERLHRAYVGALESLAESAGSAGDTRRAAEWWRRLAAEEPDNSRAVLGLMGAMAGTGDRAGALRRAREHADHLRREYGAEPDPTVTEHARRIQEEPQAWLPDLPVAQTLPGLPGRSSLPRGRRARILAGGLLVIAAVTVAGIVLRGGDRAPAPGVEGTVAPAPGIAVLPFTVNDPDLDLWREGMVDLLATNLDGVAGLRAIDSRTVLARWAGRVSGEGPPDRETALDVARDTGARYAVLGGIVSSPHGMRMSADLYDLATGRKLVQRGVDGAQDSIFGMVDRLSVDLLREILMREDRTADLARVDLARSATRSFPALKAYLEGEALRHRMDPAAGDAFRRAIEADSTFALAIMHGSEALGFVNHGMEFTAEQWTAMLDRLPQRERLMGRSDLAWSQGRLRESLALLEEASARFPDDVDAWYRLGELTYHFGPQLLLTPDDAEAAFSAAVALDPRFVPAYFHLIKLAFDRADRDRVTELVEALGQNRTGSNERRIELLVESVRSGTGSQGRAEELELSARLALELAFGDSAAGTYARAALSRVPGQTLELIRSDFNHPRFLELFAEIQDKVDAAHPTPAGHRLRFQNYLARGRLLAALDYDPAEFAESDRTVDSPIWPPERLFEAAASGMPVPLASLAEAVARSDTAWMPQSGPSRPSQRSAVISAILAADQGRWGDHAAALDRIRRANSPEWPYARSTMIGLEGYGLWKKGRETEAISVLQDVQTGDEYLRVSAFVRWWLGRLLLETGRPAEAERYFRSLWSPEFQSNPLPFYYLGQVYEQLGEEQKARAAFQYFADAWQDADPPLQPFVREARQAIVRLSPSPTPP
ncbi:MAG TPA: BTAD domain-containing putative transcriptional regulator [Gemmatimonadota bacterium]|nr:BTAD domain-containing putative transcriptional regulator [Gemmatimonadota bacterium]